MQFPQRSLSKLPTGGRPLSEQNGLERLYEARKALYQRFADHVIDNDSGSVADAAAAILEVLG